MEDKEAWMRMTLRVPVQLRDWLENRTRDTRRSLNGEIVACLETVQKETAGIASQA